MLTPPFNLNKARILLSNDDGIDAPGLKILETIARTFSDDVWVVAPLREQSATGAFPSRCAARSKSVSKG